MIPFVVEGSGTLLDRGRAGRAAVRAALDGHGAVLFGGFDIGGVGGFDGVVRAFSGARFATSSGPCA